MNMQRNSTTAWIKLQYFTRFLLLLLLLLHSIRLSWLFFSASGIYLCLLSSLFIFHLNPLFIFLYFYMTRIQVLFQDSYYILLLLLVLVICR